MNIELRFLTKAIKEKNYISFMHKGKNFKKEKALKLEHKNKKDILSTLSGNFNFSEITKFKVLKDKF